jgi:hypothetical protein
VIETIDDFDVEIGGEDRVIVFTSESQGELASFPEWERADRDLRHFVDDDIPTGTRDFPFQDAGEEWQIEIFEEEGFVYVRENANAFRVPRDAYFEAWERLIARYHPALSLDELFEENDE